MKEIVGEVKENLLVKEALNSRKEKKVLHIVRVTEKTRRWREAWRDSALRSLGSLSRREATREEGELKQRDETPHSTVGCGFHWK